MALSASTLANTLLNEYDNAGKLAGMDTSAKNQLKSDWEFMYNLVFQHFKDNAVIKVEADVGTDGNTRFNQAMAAGVPVVALNAPGVREVIKDKENGRLVEEETMEAFVQAISWIASMDEGRRRSLKNAAKRTAFAFSTSHSVGKALDLYQNLLEKDRATIELEQSAWSSILRRIEEEWVIWSNRLSAAGKAVLGNSTDGKDNP